jgi:acyl-CoA synthetase (AMP-forming)/AMP-acid ligase II
MTTFVELLHGRAGDLPLQRIFTFLDHEGNEAAALDYGQLDRRAREIAAALQGRELAGERALVVYPPGIEFIEALYGCVYAGVIAVPCPPPDPGRKYAGPRMRQLVADATPRVVLTVGAVEGSIREVLAGEGPENVATDAELGADPEAWSDQGSSPDDIVVLQYTSGSTAVPRGVMISHDNIIDNCEFIADGLDLGEGPGGVMWLPPYHDMGLVGGIFSPVHTGRTMTLMSPVSFLLDPLSWLRAISRLRATTSGGPNFAFDLCVRRSTPEQREGLDLSCWETAYNGAEPVRPETIEAFSEAFAPFGFERSAFYPCYGLAEATLMVTGPEKGPPPRVLAARAAELEQGRFAAGGDAQPSIRLTSCGRARPGAVVRIVDPDSHEPCPDATIGEIWVAGRSVAAGYWDREPETRATFDARLVAGDDGSFLRTGDLGFLVDGELYVTGRIKELLVIDGRALYPATIELAVEAAVPALRHNCSAAFLIEAGESRRLALVAEVREDHDALESVYEAMRAAVKDRFELELGAICLIEPRTIPRTSSGKTQRGRCRELFMRGRLQAVGEWLDVAGHSSD